MALMFLVKDFSSLTFHSEISIIFFPLCSIVFSDLHLWVLHLFLDKVLLALLASVLIKVHNLVRIVQ